MGPSNPEPQGPLVFVSGPWAPVVAAAIFSVLGLVLGLLVAFGPFAATDNVYLILSLIGWASSGVIAFVLLGEYLRQDNKLRAERPYIGDANQVLLYRGTIVVSFLTVLLTAVQIALWFSKL